MKTEKNSRGTPIYFASCLVDYQSLARNVSVIPLWLHRAQLLHEESSYDEKWEANLSPNARKYLASLGIENPDVDPETAALVWMHALAIGYSPAYLKENADGIRQDWPRIPLPDTKDALMASAALGKQIAALLDTETPVKGVTTGATRPDLKTIAVISCIGGGPLNPDCGDLNVTAGWGHAGKDGVTMPGKGRLDARTENGKTTYDVYLNEKAYWKNIPAPVWEYTIGGYQVIKKWLSYRECDLLGRGLTDDEAREVTNMARRIAAIIALEPELDANYKRVKESVYKWQG